MLKIYITWVICSENENKFVFAVFTAMENFDEEKIVFTKRYGYL